MNKTEFIRQLSFINVATSITGKKYRSIQVYDSHIRFIRDGKTQYENISIDELFELYTKENNITTSIAKSYISGRVQSPAVAIFNHLKSGTFINQSANKDSISQKTTQQVDPTYLETTKDKELLMKVLMNEKNFKDAAVIDVKIPNSPGLYCIRIKNPDLLPTPFNAQLKIRGHNIVYLGIASKSLKQRLLNQELRAKGHGTFFRSIGAVLGFRPTEGTLKNKANKKNFKFSNSDEIKIIEWMNFNLIVNWIEYGSDFDNVETYLIQKYQPLFNLAKNPLHLKELSILRAECVKIANN